MLTNLDIVFRLSTWTILRRKGAYYITKEERSSATGKSYKSLRHATTAIARKLEEEFATRDARYGKR